MKSVQIGIQALRDNLGNVFDSIRFQNQRYLVTTHNTPLARLIPPISDPEAISVSILEVRRRTHQILHAAGDEGKTFLVHKHGQVIAAVVPPGDAHEPSNRVQPTLTVLSPEQIAQVHEYSLSILATVGVRVDSEPAWQLFAQAIGLPAIGPAATSRAEPVRLPHELVAWALETAPSSLDVYDRRGELAFHLPGPARFGIGVTALYYQDPVTDAGDALYPAAHGDHRAAGRRPGQL